MLWKPLRRPLLLQFLVVAAVILGVVGLVAGDPESLAAIVIAAILVALYPNRQALTEVRPVRWNIPLLAIAIVAALVALPYAIDMFQLQLDDTPGDEHAEFTHWALSLVLLLNLLAAGVLAATGRPGSRILGILGGVAFIYLGVAALTSRDGGGIDPIGIWSTFPALLSILAGIGYIAATLMEERIAGFLPKFGGRPRPAT